MVTRFCLFIFILFSTTLFAGEVIVATDRDPVALNETFRIIFTVRGKQDAEPDFSPLNKDFQLLGTSQSSSFSMVNGKTSSSKTYTLTVAANRKGKLTIPPISFGKDESSAYEVTVLDASQSSPGAPSTQPQASADQLFMTAEVDSKQPYVQQQVILKLKIYRRIDWADATLSDPAFEGVEALIQSLGKEKTYETNHKGKRYLVTELRYALFPQQSGELTIEPFRLTTKVRDGSQKRSSPFGGRNDPFFDDFFTRPSYKVQSTQSQAIKLDIKAIPADFKGKHWLPAKSIQLQETWSGDTSKLTAGEPITRTIALIADGLGTGQLPEIKQPDQPGLKSYPDQPTTQEQTTRKGLLSTVTQKLALIPSQGGQFKLPAIEIPWWNTVTGKMEIARIAERSLLADGKQAGIGPAPDVRQDPQPTAQPSAPSEPITSQPQDEPVPYLWLLIACLTLLLLWLVTLAAWLKGRTKTPTKSETQDTKPARVISKQALKALKTACDSKEANKVRDALIEWSQTIWTDQPPTNLDDIAKRVNQELSKEIEALSQSLYSHKTKDWDPQKLYTLASQLKIDKSTMEDNEDLEPLYR